MEARDGLSLAQALVTATIAGDHRMAQALANQYVAELDPAELLVWSARYSGLLLDLLARADTLGRTPAEWAESLARQISTQPGEPPNDPDRPW
ncbi:MAG: hypothetical protein ACRDZY_00390 [Acidimicrobiales bacterium]